MAPRNKETFVVVGIVVGLVLLIVVAVFIWLPSGGGDLSNPGGPLVEVTGTITMNNNQHVLNLTVGNAANYNFVRIELSDISPLIPGAIDNVTFSYNGEVVSPSNQLSIGDSASGVYFFNSGVDIGMTYSVTLTVMLSDGHILTGNASIIGQA